MKVIIEILATLIALILLIPSLVLFFECLLALWSHNSQPAENQQAAKIIVLVPAHNEASVIGETLDSLLSQVTEPESIVVIADNCNDDTAAIARQSGVRVIERKNEEKKGKGYALDFGLTYLEKQPPEVVILVDADCRVEEGAIEKLSNQVLKTGKPVQGTYLMETPDNPSTKDVISALAFLVKNQVRFTGLAQLGLPCLLAGTGMAFPWSVIRQVDLASGNIVEDMQLGIDLAVLGFAPRFCPQARITGILPKQQQSATTQRTRWEHGHVQTIITQVPRLLTAAIRQRRIELFALALELGVPPLSLFVMVWGVALIGSLILGSLMVIWLPTIILGIAGLLIFLAIIMAWSKFGREKIPAKVLIGIPLYLFWKIPMYIALLSKPEKQWIRTERD